MEIFMKGVNWSASRTDVVLLLAARLHHADFMGSGEPDRFNFHVHLFRDKDGKHNHSGLGTLTVPTPEIGRRFLALYEGSGLKLKGKTIWFSCSRSQSGHIQLKNIRYIASTPYVNPLDREAKTRQESSSRVPLRSLQFGWECRDQVVSIESEASRTNGTFAYVSLEKDKRRFRIQYTYGGYTYYTVVHFSQIEFLTAHTDLDESTIVFTLVNPPTYEADLKPVYDFHWDDDDDSEEDQSNGPFRRQLSYLPLPDNHYRVAPYASHVVRLVCNDAAGLRRFKELSKDAGYDHIRSDSYIVERRGLFSGQALEEYERQKVELPWCIVFQVEAVVRARSLSIQEMLGILPDIKQLLRRKGKKYVASVLQDFVPKAHALFREDGRPDAAHLCFKRTIREHGKNLGRGRIRPVDESLFESYHVTVTPTTMVFEGPSLERSNRVIRSYGEEHHDSFLRVTFAEESRLQLRFEKEVDGAEYIKSRIRPILFEGLKIAGRRFHFLAYSQSALKEHSVWFVKAFKVRREGQPDKVVSASDIIANLGNFKDLAYDPKLIYCPARYAARISQAFTATEASISVDIEEILVGKDITVESGGQTYNHTDGVGTMSKEVAEDIGRAVKRYSPAIQVRVQGAKGMLSVDHKLQGRVIVVRSSMIKFDAPTANNIEIAQVFDRPMAYFLNRPLIMLLEDLGVPYETFKKFQDRAVRETEEATQTLSKAGKLLECHGLGASYRISSVMNSLANIGITSLRGDSFYDKSMEFAKNHILRDLKHHARIPVPGAWTLVGVADVHGFLEERQIFACVRPAGGEKIYLEGPVIISRSPTIHPGDVQVARAIGRPPPGSCFAREDLVNSVAFSIKGDRPLPSYLAGGDLDGDIYNIIPLNTPELTGFKPNKLYRPATYAPAERRVLDRPSTMRDVAEFVMDYLLSDILGLIAVTWLIVADQSNIRDPVCITLANLHSDAVDYPKSGQPVDRRKIPRWKRPERPDWNAPETANLKGEDGKMFYESQRAIGKLFRAIDLPVEERPMDGATRVRRRRRPRREGEEADDGVELSVFAYEEVYWRISRRVGRYLPNHMAPVSERLWDDAERLFERYATELQGICMTKTLSSSRGASLAEEEAMMGTIVHKTSQPRRRKDMMARLRESTDLLVRGVREILEGEEGSAEEEFLQRSWYAWSFALERGREFGAQSFSWVALGAIFEAIRRIRDREWRKAFQL